MCSRYLCPYFFRSLVDSKTSLLMHPYLKHKIKYILHHVKWRTQLKSWKYTLPFSKTDRVWTKWSDNILKYCKFVQLISLLLMNDRMTTHFSQYFSTTVISASFQELTRISLTRILWCFSAFSKNNIGMQGAERGCRLIIKIRVLIKETSVVGLTVFFTLHNWLHCFPSLSRSFISVTKNQELKNRNYWLSVHSSVKRSVSVSSSEFSTLSCNS